MSWIVTDGPDGEELAGPFGSEETAQTAADNLQAEGHDNAQTAYVND